MDDASFMSRALELGGVSEGSVSPRPPVGTVVVSGTGRIVGEGYDTPSPGPHAETVALEAAGDAARGSTVYVTLEPCSHTSATPPCAEALVAAGVRRVVIGTRDPDPRVDGRGISILRKAGIEVTMGVLRRRAQALIAPFAKWTRTGRPFLTLKLAASLDGKVAAPDGTSRWITDEPAREEVHELRRRVDAVLVGSGTVIADDPALTFRLPGIEGTQPLRVVADSSARVPASARVYDSSAPTLLVTNEDAPPDRLQARRGAGIEVATLPAAEGGVDLSRLADELGRRGICHVLCEGGPTLAGSLVSAGLVDRLVLYLAPILLGGGAPGMFTAGVKTLEDAWRMRIEHVRRVGADIRIDATVRA